MERVKACVSRALRSVFFWERHDSVWCIERTIFVVMDRRKVEKHLTRQFEQQVARASIEREQKYRIKDVRPVRRLLLKLGATPHTSGFERNELFDRDGWLSTKGRKLRLRRHGRN